MCTACEVLGMSQGSFRAGLAVVRIQKDNNRQGIGQGRKTSFVSEDCVFAELKEVKQWNPRSDENCGNMPHPSASTCECRAM